jgi:Raf kinase inhibitor-like YbhB/YbcL family protein
MSIPAADGGGGASGAGSGGSAAGAGGSPGMPAAGSGGSAGAGGSNATQMFALMPVGATMIDAQTYAFPADAQPPTNHSPEFSWGGVPAAAKSLVLTFRDDTAGAVKWVIWDMPPATMHLPSGVGTSAAMPTEVPGSSQLGSLGNQGYAGPCCMQNHYQFVLWALDVDKLPDTAGLSTAQIYDMLLPKHMLAKTPPVDMRIAR